MNQIKLNLIKNRVRCHDDGINYLKLKYGGNYHDTI